ncbi:MAG: type II secretion system F family protein [Acidimicrobiales bacterium]
MTATMLKFKYQAETLDGEQIKGEIEASSANAARNQLAIEGIRVTKIAERKGLQVELTQKKVPLVDIMHFSRQMATFIRAGIPVIEALREIRQDVKNPRFAAILSDVLDRVASGRSLTESLQRHAEVFPSYMMAMLGSAELTGKMDEAFDQAHRYIRRDVELARAVRKALIYPMILMAVAVIVVAIIVIFVIPKFAEFFKSFNAELPLPTRMLMSVADFVGSTAGAVTGILIIAAVIATVLYVRTPTGHRNRDALLLKVPALNTVIIYAATERFTRVLGTLIDAGVPLPEALPSATECTNNDIFKERLAVATEQVLSGQGFADPIRQTELFPTTVIQMVRVGERSGELTEQLNNVAGFFEDELSYAVDKLTQWFEPVVILFIGVVVGFVALAMVSAMYGIYNQVKV